MESDELVSAELRSQLLEAIVPFEEMAPDWHHGSNDQVLDPVHPSLHPIVYGRTLLRSGGPEPPEAPSSSSDRGRRLPDLPEIPVVAV